MFSGVCPGNQTSGQFWVDPASAPQLEPSRVVALPWDGKPTYPRATRRAAPECCFCDWRTSSPNGTQLPLTPAASPGLRDEWDAARSDASPPIRQVPPRKPQLQPTVRHRRRRNAHTYLRYLLHPCFRKIFLCIMTKVDVTHMGLSEPVMSKKTLLNALFCQGFEGIFKKMPLCLSLTFG